MYNASLRRGVVLLKCSRHLRVTRQCYRRTLATAIESGTQDIDLPPPLPEVSLESKSSKNIEGTAPESRAVFVRPWDGISSMPELLAIVRGLERHYGRIREYGVLRDYDLISSYIPYFWVNFEDAASLERVPEAPSLLKLDVPRVDLAKPGGIGLEDLQGLLSPENYVPPEDLPHEAAFQASAESTDKSNTVTVDVRIERAKIQFQPGKERTYPMVDRSFQGAFYGWGGFYQLPAPDAVHPAATMQRGLLRRKNHKQTRASSAEPADEFEEGAEDLDDAGRVSLMQSTSPVHDDAALTSTSASPTETDLASSTSDVIDTVASTNNLANADPEAESAPVTPRLSKRELILARARANARAPLPASLLQTDEEKQREKQEKLAQEKEEEDRVRMSVRERLWKLVGSKWM